MHCRSRVAIVREILVERAGAENPARSSSAGSKAASAEMLPRLPTKRT
jgi:hypothetical protein